MGTLGVINDTAQSQALLSNQSQYAGFSDFDGVFERKETQSQYATYENNFWMLDGSMRFLPDAASQYEPVGIVSKNLFSSSFSVKMTFQESVDIAGLTIKFAGNYPSKFSIITSDGTSKSYSNSSLNFTTDDRFDNTTSLEIKVAEMSSTNNRVRIESILFGSAIVFTDNDIINAESTSTISQINEDLPEVNFTLMSKPENIKRLKNIRTVYSKSDTLEEVVSEEVEWTNETLLYTFDEPHHSYTASLENQANGQSVEISDSGAYFVELKLSGNDMGKKVQVIVNGKKFNQSNAYSVAEISNYGVEKDWSNPLISDKQLCDKVCKWVADYYNPGIDYSIDYRGEPALDAGDTIYQENRDGEMVKTVAESVSLTYDGTVSGTLETRR